MFTIGQLAECAGLSPKALRIYEEKGLIQPVRDDENNYRYYDEDAKETLQKILMLKFLGFSLEQIHDFLQNNRELSLEESFAQQKRLLNQKKEQMETVIACLDKAIWECRENQLDIDALLENMKAVVKDRRADERIYDLYKYSAKAPEWNRWVFEKAEVGKHAKVLDAGAGWGNIWRQNMERLPEGIHVTCIDKHNTWADDFCTYVKEETEKGIYQENTFEFLWGDMEAMEIPGRYDCIFFNHVAYFMKNAASMYETLKSCLKENGVFICTWGGILFYHELLAWIKEFGYGINVMEKKTKRLEDKIGQQEIKLEEVFSNVEKHAFEIEICFTNAEECYDYCIKICQEIKPEMEKKEKEFLDFLKNKADENGMIMIRRDTYMYRCKNDM